MRYLVTVFLLLSLILMAQIQVNNTYSPQYLVQNVLLGQGVFVSNIQFYGNNTQIGKFSGTSSIGINEGIILATGDAKVSLGPNNSDNATLGSGIGGDADLTNLIGSNTFDAAVLEFDFIPYSDTIRFFYVFASEEYPEYVCSNYNDVFAFFLTGPKPGGGSYIKENIAKIPGTSIPVAINSINPGTPGFFGSPGGCISLSYSNLYNSNTGGTTHQFDGFTDVLEAYAPVIPCQTYHIKIAIADVTDGNYDSGVFLKAKSFSSPTYGISAVGSSFDSTMVESCGYATYIFTRSGNISLPDTISIIIDGSAINGIDYTDLNNQPIPNQVIFEAGKDTAYLYINPVADFIHEDTETVVLKVIQNISCIQDTLQAIIYIINVDSIKINLTGDTIICQENGEQSILHVSFTGGYGPFNIIWDDTQTSDSIRIVAPEQTTIYTVYITDTCGNASYSKSIRVINECDIHLTNVITPNQDGYNDILRFKNLEMFPGSRLWVYNRWGKLVYSSDNYQNDWSPSDLSPGTYFYILHKSAGYSIPEKKYQGTITIIK